MNRSGVNRIVNYAPTGTQTTRANSHAPMTVSEIVEDVHRAYESGITVAHVHAREEDGSNTLKVDVYGKILDGIRSCCPDLAVCISLSGRFCQDVGIRAAPLELRPDLASLTMSSMNFPQGASVNDPKSIEFLAGRMSDNGVNPEIECFDSGMLWCARKLVDRGLLPKPSYANMIFGNMYNSPPDAASVSSVLSAAWDGCDLCFGGIGKEQLRSNMLGLLYAGGIRIGLEDNLYYEGKQRATNFQLLGRMRRIMSEMGLQMMPAKEFKEKHGNRMSHSTGV